MKPKLLRTLKFAEEGSLLRPVHKSFETESLLLDKSFPSYIYIAIFLYKNMINFSN